MSKLDHISFSSLKKFYECSYLFKLLKIDKIISEPPNVHLAFGKSMHHICERIHKNQEHEQLNKEFDLTFLSELKHVPKEIILENKNLVKEMRGQAKILIPLIYPELKKTFGDFKVVSIEEDLMEKIKDIQTDIKFNGFIDLIIQTENDNKFHILDWKTCGWGWDPQKKNDKQITYQLTYYKLFWSQKHQIERENIETHFALLKRTAKKDNVEIFRVTSGDRKISNAIDFLRQPIEKIEKNLFFKKKSDNCQRCIAFQKGFCK